MEDRHTDDQRMESAVWYGALGWDGHGSAGQQRSSHLYPDQRTVNSHYARAKMSVWARFGVVFSVGRVEGSPKKRSKHAGHSFEHCLSKTPAFLSGMRMPIPLERLILE